MFTNPRFVADRLKKSLVPLGLIAIISCTALAGCGKPVAQQKDMTPESKEELRAQLQQRAAREQEGL
ncbi:hypothetical protein [Bremerella sp. P1]|uniref:hypothetical protein n=1 Tax=Bremerella sp. P1 TaxID=3026424 RepID=UPI002367B667|nr:hypothetical protein [Bremerella sp. P1]WDI42730.1 hypothetical protein PSR63_02070 [Bremerella sp. P1]